MGDKVPSFVACAIVNFAATAHVVSRALLLNKIFWDPHSTLWCIYSAATTTLWLLTAALAAAPEPAIAWIAVAAGIAGIAFGEAWYRQKAAVIAEGGECGITNTASGSGSESDSDREDDTYALCKDDPYSITEHEVDPIAYLDTNLSERVTPTQV